MPSGEGTVTHSTRGYPYKILRHEYQQTLCLEAEKAAEVNKKELESWRMVIARKPTAAVGPRTKNVDCTFGPWRGEDGQLKMGISDLKQERADGRDWLSVGRKKYEFIPGFSALLNQIHPINYTEADLEEYTEIVNRL